jgi:hypothetical protein
MIKKFITSLFVIVAATSAAHASEIVNINFDTYAPDTRITSLPGVTFSLIGGPATIGAPVIDTWGNNGISNTTTGVYPTAQILNVLFSGPASDVSFTFDNYGSANGSFYTAFNAEGDVLATGSVQNLEGGPSSLVNIAASGITDLQFNNNTGGRSSWLFDVGSLHADVGSVPEPGTLALLGIASLGLGLLRRRKNA